jgi:Protein of unknown function (DUF3833)
MKIIVLCAAIASMGLWLSACSSNSISNYRNNIPVFKPDEFFNGQLIAHGVVKNRAGTVTRYFVANIRGDWENGRGELKEEFLFNDGEIQYRTWIMTLDSNGKLRATANDTLGEANGDYAGNAMYLNYQLKVKYKENDLVLKVQDWMWLIDKNTLLNESTLSKWGFKVGSVQLTIKRLE